MSAQFLLETNIVSDLLRIPQGRAAATVAEVGEDVVATSTIVAAQFGYGPLKKGSERLASQLESRSGCHRGDPSLAAGGRNLRGGAGCPGGRRNADRRQRPLDRGAGVGFGYGCCV